jgi:putative ABC transport system permease protein
MWIPALDRKLLRDVARLKGQIVTIALVLAGGITCFISLRGTYDSLENARSAFYDRYRFAHVFAEVERAPESLAGRLEALPGVEVVETRVSEEITLPLQGMARPAYAHLLSLPASGEPRTNAVHLVTGRLPERGRDDEVALLESFATGHGLAPGHLVPAVINGKLRSLKVVGIVLSPEFVYTIRPGALFNDPKRYAVLWMERTALASALQLDGAFNDVTFRLQSDANEAAVRAHIDRVLAPYGGDGAIGRTNQISNRILTSELSQLRALAGMVPLVFLGVVGFLINLVLGRLISLQRMEIAALKAVGYTNGEISRHYLGLIAIVMLPGTLVGLLGGWALGRVVLQLYADLFRFPGLAFRMSVELVTAAVAVSMVGAASGALLAIRAAVRLPPAEAMRAPAPLRYRKTLLERIGLGALVGPSGMMVLREIQRRPLRTALSSVGIAGAVALMLLGRFGLDSLDSYLEGTLRREQRQDLAVAFSRPVTPNVIGQLARVPGVLTAEGVRAVPIRIRTEHRMRDSVLMGLPAEATLRRLVGRGGREIPIPSDGVLMTNTLGDILGLRIGDRVDLEVRQGDRRVVRPVLVGFVDETVGLQVYARADLVASLEGDLGAVSSALLKIDPPKLASVEERLRRAPHVIDVSDLVGDMQRLRDMNASMMDVWTAVSITLSGCVIFGVVYNNARIALAMRSRELASLRVLGLSRREIASILIAGLAVEVAIAIPIGLVLGRLWAAQFMQTVDQETFRWAVVIAPRTYLLAAMVAVLAAAASALWVQRNLDRLDLIGVLKTRE